MKKMMAIALMIVLLGAAYAVAQNQEEAAEALEVILALAEAVLLAIRDYIPFGWISLV